MLRASRQGWGPCNLTVYVPLGAARRMTRTLTTQTQTATPLMMIRQWQPKVAKVGKDRWAKVA
eukprot:5434477-Amphidinium_carterae.2